MVKWSRKEGLVFISCCVERPISGPPGRGGGGGDGGANMQRVIGGYGRAS